MKRNFPIPQGSCLDPGSWNMQQRFERQGDDNQEYFMDNVMQLYSGGPADVSDLNAFIGNVIHNGSDLDNETNFIKNLLISEPYHQITTFLCTESDTISRDILLKPNGSARIFIDAYEPWQTTPINVFAGALPGNNSNTVHTGQQKLGTTISYHFLNYKPIDSTKCYEGALPISSANTIKPGWWASHSPIIRTLGSLNRTPNGISPVPDDIKQKQVWSPNERPYILIWNHNQTSNVILRINVAI